MIWSFVEKTSRGKPPSLLHIFLVYSFCLIKNQTGVLAHMASSICSENVSDGFSMFPKVNLLVPWSTLFLFEEAVFGIPNSLPSANKMSCQRSEQLARCKSINQKSFLYQLYWFSQCIKTFWIKMVMNPQFLSITQSDRNVIL
jgi:hypothetical protein